MNKFIFTFGANHDDPRNGGLGNCYTVIQSPTDHEAIALMTAKRGRKWAFCYNSEEGAGVKKWRLRFVPFESMATLNVEGAE